jgi:hypothetical protein
MHMAAFSAFSARTYLLSLSPPSPLPPLLTPPFKCDIRAAGLRSHFRPPPTPPQEDYGQILATSLKVEDGLHLGVCEYGSWTWTATVILGAVIGHLEAEIEFLSFHRKW